MQRVTRSTAVATLPAPPAGAGAPGYFSGGNPGTGTPATIPGYEWCNSVQEELISIVLAAGLTPDANDLAQVLAALNVMYQRSDGLGYMIVADEKSLGVGGGVNVSGEQVRTLNVVRHNSIVGASLSANRILLPAGDYIVRASAPGYSVNAHRVSVYNYTGGVTALVGTAENATASSEPTDPVQTRSFVAGSISLAVPSELELRHYAAQVYATGSAGLGSPAGIGTEVYSMIEIQIVG